MIAEVDGYLVEIQVRTRIQHWWAQLLEKIADAWGRQVRYGQEPTEPGADAGGRTRREVLIVYDRSSGRVIFQREYAPEQREEALRERFSREEAEKQKPEIEVVLLSADSLGTLKRTHSRYFQTRQEIARSVPR